MRQNRDGTQTVLEESRDCTATTRDSTGAVPLTPYQVLRLGPVWTILRPFLNNFNFSRKWAVFIHRETLLKKGALNWALAEDKNALDWWSNKLRTTYRLYSKPLHFLSWGGIVSTKYGETDHKSWISRGQCCRHHSTVGKTNRDLRALKQGPNRESNFYEIGTQ